MDLACGSFVNYLLMCVGMFGAVRCGLEKRLLVSCNGRPFLIPCPDSVSVLGGHKGAVCFPDVERDEYVRMSKNSDVLSLCQQDEVGL